MRDKDTLREAINAVIAEPDPGFMRDALEAVGALACIYPLELAHELAILNPLLRLQVTDEATYTRVRRFIDERRRMAGQPPCWPEPQKVKFKDRVNDYQAELMRQRRDRPRRAAELEALQRSERDQLKGDPRVLFMKNAEHRWTNQLKAIIEAARKSEGGHLPKAQADAIKQKFWGEVDAELDEREALIRAELLKPAHQRRKI